MLDAVAGTGRGAQLDELSAAVRAGASGHGELVLVTGEAGNAGQVRAEREQLVDDYRALSRGWQDEAGLLELAWNKALAAVEHPDPHKRAQERADPQWWLRTAAPRPVRRECW